MDIDFSKEKLFFEQDDYFRFDSDILPNKRKYLVVIIYDIVNIKTRRKMVKYLNSFGVRVQKSAFECILEESKFNKLTDGITKITSEDDLVRAYKLQGNADVRAWGRISFTDQENVVIL
ncbi:MAG: CRISPR-associated endonuclease Cas2 [Saccharofermentanales bacterium]